MRRDWTREQQDGVRQRLHRHCGHGVHRQHQDEALHCD